MTKTNKSYTKRLKVTRNGKLVSRAKGQNHYNAKDTGSERLTRRTTKEFAMKNKDRGRFLQK